MDHICHQCSAPFEVTKEDLAFYEKVSPVIGGQRYDIPPPTLCPACRLQRRLSWRNDMKVYHRKCDQTGRPIISIYAPGKSLRVYATDEWWKDTWDPLSYGRDFDFDRPFFEQFDILKREVPRPALNCEQSENCHYCQNTTFSKNCYLCFTAGYCEDCYYGYIVTKSSSVSDCLTVRFAQLCYECVDCRECYNGVFLQDCVGCTDCAFCFDCRNCKQCIGCVGLSNKENHLFNQPSSADEIRRIRATLSSQQHYSELQEHFERFKITRPCRASFQVGSEACTGDHIYFSRNAQECFEVENCEDAAYCNYVANFKDSRDVFGALMGGELQYENSAAGGSTRTMFAYLSWHNADCAYLNYCHNSRDLFGCISLHHKQNCILNKQYTKDEYERLLPRIIEHMRGTGEWGEFFPAAMSPYGYNETIADDFFPLSQEEVLHRGWQWFDEVEHKENYLGPPTDIPDDIGETSDDICQQILLCEKSGKPYKIIPQELQLYRDMCLPVPRRCFEQRHKDRLARRNPRKLWNRNCAKCSKPIQTTYSPERPEIVYCERCYLETVY